MKTITTLNDFIAVAQNHDFLFLDSVDGFILQHKAGDGLSCCFEKTAREKIFLRRR